MNKAPDPKTARKWAEAPEKLEAPVGGYDDWLAGDIAEGVADLDAGRSAPIGKMRKEFGLE